MKINGYTIERGANLRSANLWGADLECANLEGANLEGANLRSANLHDANLYDANLRGTDLECANLEGANLRSANLWGADLECANLEGANLEGANLWGATLYDANLQGAAGGILQVSGTPSGDVTLVPTCDGWVLRVGDWAGNPDSFRILLAQDAEWIEAQGEETALRVQIMAALADLCDAYAAAHQADLAAVAHWTGEDDGEDDR